MVEYILIRVAFARRISLLVLDTSTSLLLDPMEYLFKFIFPFLGSSVEAKRGVEIRYSACYASRIRREVGNGLS